MRAAYAFAPMTDTQELPCLSGARLAAADTMWIPLAAMFEPIPAPEPPPVPARLPKRLRRRVAAQVAMAVGSATGFTTALLAGGVL
jgi:hypothetical protein